MTFGTDYNYITEEEFNTISGSIESYIDDEATTVSGALQSDLDQKSDSDHTHVGLFDKPSEIIALTDATASGSVILWSQEIVEDSTYSHTTGSESITTLSGGDYQVYYNLQWENTSVDPLTNIMYILVNGNYVIPQSISYAYSPSSVYASASNIKSLIYTFSANDSFSLTISGSIGGGADWFNSDWGFRKKIIIDNTKVSGSANLTDFPILINTTDVDFKDTGNGGNVGKSNGGDILFTASDGTTQLKHEIEKYVNTSGELIAWVKISSLDYNDDTEIYMYYGYAAAADQADPTNVWDSNYVGVYHLKEDPTDPDPGIKDSTSFANHGTVRAGMVSGDQVTGQIDGSLQFVSPGQDNYGVQNDGVAGDVDTDLGTIEMWVKRSFADNPGNSMVLVQLQGPDTKNRLRIQFSIADEWRIAFEGQDINVDKLFVNSLIPQNTWKHFVTTWDVTGDELAAFVSGSEVGSPSTGLVSPTAFQESIIGNRVDYTNPWEGVIDEIRYSDIVRSDGWILTSFNSQNSPSTFYSIEAEESDVGSGVSIDVRSSSSLNCSLLKGN